LNKVIFENTIEASNLTKSFGKNIAVNDVSFQLKKGEVLGF
jgi:ABC-type multidrug transport system ATPase subunit